MTISIKPTASGSTIEQDGSTILTVDGSGNISIANDLSVTGNVPANTGPAFRAYIGGGTDQSISANTWTKVNLATESFDTDSCFDTSTYRFTPNVAGYYQVNGSIMHNHSGTTTVALTSVYKNGSSMFLTEWANWSFGSGNSINCSDIVYMNGSTDYLELYGYSGSSSATFNREQGNTFLSASLVRAA